MGKASKRKQSLSADVLENKKEALVSSTSSAKENLFYKQMLHLLLIAVLGLLVYSNTFHSPFQWDEAEYILNNPIIRDLGYFVEPSKLEGSWLYYILKSRYIGYLTFALNYKLHGYDVVGYHVVNLTIHIINAMLVYFLVALTFRTPFFLPTHPPFTKGGTGGGEGGFFTRHASRVTAFAVALLFVAHPIQTEAVTYVFQRLASLVSMFYLLSLVLYIKARLIQVKAKAEKESVSSFKTQSSTLTFYILSLLSAVLAMKTKENAFTLPVVMTLYEFLFFTGPLKSRALRLAPFLLTMLIVPFTLFGTGRSAGELMSQIQDPQSLGYQELSRGDYLFTQMRVIMTYIRLLVLPVHQNIDYDYPVHRSFFDPPVFLSLLFLTSLFGAAIYLLFRSRAASNELREESKQYAAGSKQPTSYFLPLTSYYRLVSFGILWFFITLSVESSVIPIPMLINEYRLYLPSVGFFLAVTTSALTLYLKFAGPFLKKQKIVLSAFVVIILALASATYARNAVWKDKVSLWEDVIRKSPDSSRGYNNLGIAYFDKGLYEKAIEMYERCLALRPAHRDAHINLGVVYATIGQLDRAIVEFRMAIAIEPMNNTAYCDLARAYSDAGQDAEAAGVYLRATELNPYNSAAYHGLGTSYMRLGRVDDALAAYTKFVSLSPYDPEAYRNRGIAYGQKGDMANARADFEKSCSLGSAASCNYLQDPRFR